jgi:hypothetical protein
MAYIGKAPNTAIVNQTTSQSFNGNGSATAFTLNRSVNVGEDLEVFVDNVQQEPGSGKSYTASGTTLTFDEAPPSGTGNVYVIYRGEATINPRLEHDANSPLAATTGTFTGAFTSPGIDDNADATAITIDSSETVLVGKTATNYQTVGVEAKANGSLWGTADGNNPLILVRKSSDGAVAQFYKDSTNVGGVQSRGGAVTSVIFDPRSNGAGITGTTNAIMPTNQSGAIGDGTAVVDLGASGYRYRNLFLSGNIYLGGTGSANAMDDYEIGNITSSGLSDASGAGLSLTFNAGNYVKVGDMVCFEIDFSFPSTSNGSTAEVTCLPFAQVSNYGVGAIGYHTRGGFTSTYILGNTQKVRFASSAGSNFSNANMSGVRLIMTYIYRST